MDVSAGVLMIQGTTSGAGKSLVAAGLCRLFARRGRSVAPFKCQNFSLNSFATPEGGEIGRAQALQAAAAGIPPHVDLNPILLKPAGRRGCQLILLGRPLGHFQFIEYDKLHGELFPTAMAALDRLRAAHEVVFIEGAGSPAEINLRGRDIANMAVAKYARAPVLLVGDIDRGGVFASLLGTVELLADEERDLVRGLVINKMRGDPHVLDPGLEELALRSGKPVMGVVPYLPDLGLDDEDALDLDERKQQPSGSTVAEAALRIAVVRLPHISNTTDFQPLEREPGVIVEYATKPDDLAGAAAVILPGSKETPADLAWLGERGLGAAILTHHAAGGVVMGICGGLQMLGTTLREESTETAGLDLLPVETEFRPEKRVVQVRARTAGGFLDLPAGLPLVGYEIHTGRTRRTAGQPFSRVQSVAGEEYDEGAVSADGGAAGTYLHGVFDSDEFRAAWLAALRRRARVSAVPRATGSAEARNAALDRLADALADSLDLAAIEHLIDESRRRAR
jgi:adenosylcobyric acid synthase